MDGHGLLRSHGCDSLPACKARPERQLWVYPTGARLGWVQGPPVRAGAYLKSP